MGAFSSCNQEVFVENVWWKVNCFSTFGSMFNFLICEWTDWLTDWRWSIKMEWNICCWWSLQFLHRSQIMKNYLWTFQDWELYVKVIVPECFGRGVNLIYCGVCACIDPTILPTNAQGYTFHWYFTSWDRTGENKFQVECYITLSWTGNKITSEHSKWSVKIVSECSLYYPVK